MLKPYQPGLPYLVRDACYSEDAADVIISILVPQPSLVISCIHIIQYLKSEPCTGV